MYMLRLKSVEAITAGQRSQKPGLTKLCLRMSKVHVEHLLTHVHTARIQHVYTCFVNNTKFMSINMYTCFVNNTKFMSINMSLWYGMVPHTIGNRTSGMK